MSTPKPKTADGVEFNRGMMIYEVREHFPDHCVTIIHFPAVMLAPRLVNVFAHRANAVRRQVELLREHAKAVNAEADEIEATLNQESTNGT